MKSLKIKCPHCNSDITIQLDNNLNICDITISGKKYTSQKEISSILKKNNIEFG
jgi:uncharacterized protein YuzE